MFLDNGYRDFREEDLEVLKKFVLRRLGLSVEEIRLVLKDETNSALERIALQKELSLEKRRKRPL